jgi:hypothetical protein
MAGLGLSASPPAGRGRLAIMQPYFFPYLGYFQLMAAVDRFIFYDDVAFIKQGWINRNRILVDSAPKYMTVPIMHRSSWTRICDTLVHQESYSSWRERTMKTLQFAYRSAPNRGPTLEIIREVLEQPAGSIADLAIRSCLCVCSRLGIDTETAIASRRCASTDLNGEARILAICRREQARTYVNLPGGRGLYSGEAFAAAEVRLLFLRPTLAEYPQMATVFHGGLSVVDVLMWNSFADVMTLLEDFALEEA